MVGAGGEDGDELVDVVRGVGRVPEGPAGFEGVVVASPDAVAAHVAGVLEVLEDEQGGAVGDAGGFGDVVNADVGVSGHSQEDVGVVGQERPVLLHQPPRARST